MFADPDYRKPYVIQRLWLKPEPGDILAGTFLGHAYEDAPFGRQSLWGVREAGNERAIPNCASLDRAFAALKPKRGQGIAIRYVGKDVGGARGHVFELKLWPKCDDGGMLAGEALASGAFEDASASAPTPTEKTGEELPF